MASIIFLFFILGASTLVSGQKKCEDVLGHCNVVKANCRSKQAEQQMKKLCARTCGFCKDEKEVIPTAKQEQVVTRRSDAQSFTMEVFLLYLKNDIKFLKEEISDVKYRLRDIEKRKQTTSVAIGGEEVKDLKYQTQRLFARIQDQTNQFQRLVANISGNLLNANKDFSGELEQMQKDITELAKDLKKDANTINKFDDELRDVKEDMNDMSRQSQATIASFSNYFRNLSSTVADRFLKLQGQFYSVLNDERVKVIEMGIKIANVTQELQREREERRKLERSINGLDSFKITEIINEDRRKISSLSRQLVNVTHHLNRQTTKTSMLTALVDELSKKKSSSGGNSEDRALIQQLQSKFNYVMRRLEVLTRRVRDTESKLNTTRTTSTSTNNAANPEQQRRIAELARNVNEMNRKIEELRQKAAKNGVSDPFKKLLENVGKGSSGGSSQQTMQVVNELSVDLENMKLKVNVDSARVTALARKIEDVNRNNTAGIRSIKETIESMASLRNNESSTIAELTSKYQRGIMSLLGPQLGNTTRFFKPRFDWENGRLSIYGYIAIYREGEYGTICDDSFDDKEAEVLCRQAGYKGGVYDGGRYKISDGQINGKGRTDYRIWIDELRCDGNELSIEDCRHGSEGWGIHDCDHGEDVGIKCYVS